MTKGKSLTPPQREALELARRSGGYIAAGITSDRGCVVRINARTIDALVRKGLAEACFSNEGGMAARIVNPSTALLDEIHEDIEAGGALADATADGLADEYAAQIAAAPTAEAAGDRYLAIRTTYRSRGLGVPAPVIEALRARFGEADEEGQR